MTRAKADVFRVGIIGAGGVSDGYHAPVLAQTSGVALAWVCDKDLAKARSFARRHRIAVSGDDLRALPDVDAVLIAIPVGARRALLRAAFERGWHALVEKPFARSLAEHGEIAAEAKAARVQVCAGLMRRFFRTTAVARNLVHRAPFGDLVELWAAEGGLMRGAGRGDDWYQNDPSLAGGGVLMETGSHLVDQALFVSGADACELSETRLRTVDGLDLEARLSARAKRKGCPFELRVALSRLDDVCAGLVLRFERAWVKVGLAPDGAVELLDDSYRSVARLDSPERSGSAIYQAFALEWEAFMGQCRDGSPGLIDAASVRLGVGLIGAAYDAKRREAVR